MIEFYNEHTPSVIFALAFLTVVAARTAYWKFAPRFRSCETCGHTGDAKRVLRGSYFIELPILALGLSVGLFVHLLLVFSLFIFIWRTLGAYLVFSKCGSERLLGANAAVNEPS
jgi:hypothetical protein